jgi:nucleotide-binding universal stress UspA family protein
VLFPLTLTLDFKQIVEGAIFLKKLNIQKFDFMHVVSSGLINTDTFQDVLQNAVEIIKQKTGYDASARMVEGHAASMIVYTAKDHDYNLIFIPAQNKSIMTRTFLGSTASDVIRMTDTPTLIYKNYSDKTTYWQTVVYATDFKVAATRAVPYIEFLGQVASKLVILHVGTRAADPGSENKRIDYIKEKFKDLKRDLEPYWREIFTFTGLGSPAGEIRSGMEKFNADLLVMGRGNKTILKKLIGSTAERVANSLETSVLLIP